MTPKKKAHLISILAELYPNPRSELDFKNEYELLIAVMLSAQCTDKKVNEVTPALFAVAGTPAQMAALAADRCGLPGDGR